jgi:pyruvate dehydrogenase (quinone)
VQAALAFAPFTNASAARSATKPRLAKGARGVSCAETSAQETGRARHPQRESQLIAAPTVASSLVDHLVAAGVRRVYGVVGDSLNGIVDEIRRNPEIRWVGVRHEEVGAFAAGAEAQLTGTLAACAGSCGPGHVHLVNGLYDCQASMAPVLAIAAHIPSPEIGTGYFQETHPERLFADCSHYCEVVSTSGQMPRAAQVAIQTALGRQGVSVMVVSGDTSVERVPHQSVPRAAFVGRPCVRPAEADLARLANLLNAGRRVTLFCGIGCAAAHAEVLALAEHLKAPVVYTLRSKGAVERDNPYAVGLTGLLGLPSGAHAVEHCDVLLMLGTDFPYRDWYPANARIAQVDIRPEHLGRRCHLDLGLVGDARETIRGLLPMLEAKGDRTHLDDCLGRHRHSLDILARHARGKDGHRPIHPELLATLVDEFAADDAIFTADTGMCCVWAARYLRMRGRRELIGSFRHGSMANALPQAIGAQFAFPGRQVVSLSGDGGLTMLMGDLLSLVQHDLPVKTVVFNNGTLGMVKMEMLVAGLPDHGTDLKNPDFARVAEAIGMRGIRVEDPADLRDAVRRAMETPGPVLLDVVTNPNELSMPPKISIPQAWGFNVSMLKELFGGRAGDVFELVESNLS